MQPNAWEICKCIFTCRALPEIKDEKSNPVSTNFSSSYGSEVDHDRMESTDSQSMEFSSGKMLGSSGRLFSVEDDIITNVNPILEDMMLQGDEDEENM